MSKHFSVLSHLHYKFSVSCHLGLLGIKCDTCTHKKEKRECVSHFATNIWLSILGRLPNVVPIKKWLERRSRNLFITMYILRSKQILWKHRKLKFVFPACVLTPSDWGSKVWNKIVWDTFTFQHYNWFDTIHFHRYLIRDFHNSLTQNKSSQ